MAINFPSSPALNQIHAVGTVRYAWDGVAWSALKRLFALPFNYLVNPEFAASIQMGDVGGGNTVYAADQWVHSTALSTAMQRYPNNYFNSYTMATWCGTAKPSLAAGDYWLIDQYLEGERIKDWAFGYPGGRALVLRFQVLVTVPGVYSVALVNAAATRSYVAQFTVTTGNTWQEVVISIPPDTTGGQTSWPVGRVLGAMLRFCLAAGTTYVGVTGWQAGQKFAAAGQVNTAAAVNNSMHIARVGLYLDLYNSGVPPLYERAPDVDTLLDSMRYFMKHNGARGMAQNSTGATRMASQNFVEMRVATPAIGGIGTPTYYDGSVNNAIGSISSIIATTRHMEYNGAATGLSAGRPILLNGQADGAKYLQTNARF